ncbi:MAG: MFS transporter [Thermomicrobiales bacterium]
MSDASRLPDSSSLPWRPELAYWLLMLYFAVLGVLVGSTGVVWASLVDEIDIDKGPFGTAQLVSAMVSTVVVVAYARLSGWRGPRLVAAAGAAVIAGSMLAMVLADSLLLLVLALALMGTGTGLTDGSMTQGSVDWEQATRRRRMNLFHAGFSIGAVFGAFGTGGLLASGLSFRLPLLIVAGLHIALLVLTAVVRFPPVDTKPRSSRFSDVGDVLESRAVRALVLIILLSIVVEIAVFIWGVIYIQTDLEGSELIGGLSYGAFNAAMFAGRLLNAPLIERRGTRASLALSGAGLILGGLLLVAAWGPAVGLVALALTGFGVAGIYPTVMSAAGDRLPGRSGTLASVMMTATYSAGMVTPPLMGWVAQFGSLRISMAAIALSGAGILWLTRRVD